MIPVIFRNPNLDDSLFSHENTPVRHRSSFAVGTVETVRVLEFFGPVRAYKDANGG